jgi:hypothetical protein
MYICTFGIVCLKENMNHKDAFLFSGNSSWMDFEKKHISFEVGREKIHPEEEIRKR